MARKKSETSSKQVVVYPFLDQPVEIYKLENGHTIVFAKKEGELVNISTWVKTGAINEDDKISGISHFLEHLMFKGTSKHPAGDFDRTLEAKGAIVNAATWKDYTFYYVTLPKGENNENLDLVLELHADMMVNSIIPDEEVGPVFDINNPEDGEKRERYVVIEEIRMRDDQPWTRTYDALNHTMYSVHPYKRDVIGTAEIISTIPRDTIVDYYKKWYTPDNFTTIIVGDFNSEDMLEKVREQFAFEEYNSLETIEHPQEPIQAQTKYVEKTGNITTGFIMFGYLGPKAKDLKNNIALDVLSIVLGEGKSARLYQNLIEKAEHPIFNLVGADQYQFKDGNNFFMQGNFNPEFKEQAIELLKVEIQKIIEDGILENEFNKAKKKLKVRFAEGAETVSEIGEAIGYYMTVCDDISACTEYLNTLNSIQKQDILEAARQYLTLEKATISVFVPEKDLQKA